MMAQCITAIPIVDPTFIGKDFDLPYIENYEI